jgi:peptidoglycan-N-acetylglucosamine deacetylase
MDDADTGPVRRGVVVTVVSTVVVLAAWAAACGSDRANSDRSAAGGSATSAPAGPTTPASPSGENASPGSRTTPTPSPKETQPAPVAKLPSALLGRDWERLPTSRRVVALTFDGGRSDAAVDSVLSTLAAANARATMFITGDFARRYPAQVRRMANAGHTLGNHSDRHQVFPDMTNAEIRTDLARAEQAIASAGGVTGPFFRFPYGARTPADIRQVNDSGYLCIRWTVDTLGWNGSTGGISADIVRQRVLDTAQPGQIVLMHLGANPDDGTTLDADALPGVISGLRGLGYSFVTLDAMLS